jgi:hypothetical protein
VCKSDRREKKLRRKLVSEIEREIVESTYIKTKKELRHVWGPDFPTYCTARHIIRFQSKMRVFSDFLVSFLQPLQEEVLE